MDLLIYILLFTALGGILSLAGGFILLIKPQFAYSISHLLASFAAGVLLGTAFFELIPESLHNADTSFVFMFVLIGILFFFLLERFLHWSHHHQTGIEHVTGRPVVPLVVSGDTFHNFIDGVAIAAAFLVNIPLGIVTAIAVGAHEIPQEIGDFGILLKQKLKRKKIIIINVLSSFAAIIGAILMFIMGKYLEPYIFSVILPITAGFFIYIALSDLVPEIHHENKRGFALKETFMLILGVVVIYFVIDALHGADLHKHEEEQVQEELQTEKLHEAYDDHNSSHEKNHNH